MKVLVMGGSYFIGKKIVEVLLDKGYEVTTLNRGTRALTDNRIKRILTDRHDIDKMKTLLKGLSFDYVIDLGVNKEEVEILCDALDTTLLKKFIFLSSSAVYDWDHLTCPFKESDDLAENSLWTSYGKNKINAEEFLKSKFQKTKTDVLVLRPPYVYGEENYAPRESFIFEHIKNDKTVILPGDGSRKIQFLLTTDLANIILALMEKDTQAFMAFNVGNEAAITMKEWVLKCGEVMNKSVKTLDFDYDKYQINPRDFFPFVDKDIVLEVNKIKTYYDKETDFNQGLKQAYHWYKNETIEFSQRVAETESKILSLLDIES